MKARSPAALDLVADGQWRYTRSKEFRARVRDTRLRVLAEFAPKLAGAPGWLERLRLRGQRYLALRQALTELYPSRYSCYLGPSRT
jgi:hypothetical protein